MLRVKPNTAPVDYRLCDRTVTIYHRAADGTVSRAVYPRAFLDFKKTQDISKTGSTQVNGFLLVIPADAENGYVTLSVGDKALLGTGPETVDWARFIPSLVPGLVVVKYVDPKYWQGKLLHMEAGG